MSSPGPGEVCCGEAKEGSDGEDSTGAAAQEELGREPEEAPVEEHATCKGPHGVSLWSSLVSILDGKTSNLEGGGGGGGGGGREKRGSGGGGGSKGRWLAVRRVITSGPMRRLQERLLGHKWYTAANAASGSAIWVLGVCYKVSPDTSNEALSGQVFQEFLTDFNSRLWLTYRRGLPSPPSRSHSLLLVIRVGHVN